jgi:anhydro-N-acetylmuramic acid kinase
MIQNVEALYTISKKKSRKIIGLMSGTSLDGLDVALCEVTGDGIQTSIKLVEFETVSFPTDFKNEVKEIFSKKNIDLEKLTLLNSWIAQQHANIINVLLKNWKLKIVIRVYLTNNFQSNCLGSIT